METLNLVNNSKFNVKVMFAKFYLKLFNYIIGQSMKKNLFFYSGFDIQSTSITSFAKHLYKISK